jgi:ABC-type uncharacterized transport system permease subunit
VPLLLLSGIFLPLTLGPGWLQGIARVSPFRYIICGWAPACSCRKTPSRGLASWTPPG